MAIELLSLLFVTLLTSLVILFFTKPATKSKPNELNELPKPYPIIGHLLPFSKLTAQEVFEWLSKIITSTPTSTIVVHQPFGRPSVFTGNPAVVEHILKTQFHIYEKGPQHKTVFQDLFGDSLFTENGNNWKMQRTFASQEFTHKALQKFVEKDVKFEISERLIPFLSDAAKNSKVIDLQDVLQRFAFDNICTVSFGYDPGYLSPSFPDAKFSRAFDESIMVCHNRFYAIFPILWKACRLLNIGSEKRLADSVRIIREFVASLINTHKQNTTTTKDTEINFLSRLLKTDQFKNEKLATDMIISYILAGRDTSSASLTWFFWLLHKNKRVEDEIIDEINKIETAKHENFTCPAYEELKGMAYTHAALSETMRLYPPVPVEGKQAASDDVLPDGTRVKKGMIVTFITYAMGRSEKLWGQDWQEFRPERWLKDRRFVPRDSYSYPVFLAGPRICLGKEMAFLQMKSVIAAVLSRFKVVPTMGDGFDPVYVPETTAKMHGGFPVRIVERVQDQPNGVN